MEKEIENFVTEYLDERIEFNGRSPEDGLHWTCDLPVDDDDAFDEEAIIQILEDDNPMQKMKDLLDNCDYPEILNIEEELLDDILSRREFTDEQAEAIQDFMRKHISWQIPYEHYLDQDVNIDICIDTGDRNYDYSLNAELDDGKLDPHASLVWLAEEQGYSYDKLNDAINDVTHAKKDKFLASVHDEVYNASAIGGLVFLVEMKLKQAIALVDRVNKSHEDVKHEYEPYLKEDNGSVILDKDVMAGLFDSWNGGGSTLGLEFDKDIAIPIKYIAKAIPDASFEYPIKDVYGLCDSAWTRSLNSIWE